MATERFEGKDGEQIEVDVEQVADIQPGEDPTYMIIGMKDGTVKHIAGFMTDIFARLDPEGRIGPRT